MSDIFFRDMGPAGFGRRLKSLQIQEPLKEWICKTTACPLTDFYLSSYFRQQYESCQPVRQKKKKNLLHFFFYLLTMFSVFGPRSRI